MTRVEHLLGHVRAQLAVDSTAKEGDYDALPAVLRLANLGFHLRERKPSMDRTVALAGETLIEIGRVLLAVSALDADEIVELFQGAVDRPDQPRIRDPRAARADLSVAMDHLLDLGSAHNHFMLGRFRTDLPLVEPAAGAAGRILAAVQKTAER